MLEGLLMVMLVLVAIFLILLVLVQRGRGGGLTGALGGMGGQSAFGTKAGDLFTKITVVTALIWGLLCLLAVKVVNTNESFDASFGAGAPPVQTQPASGGKTASGPTIPGVPAGGALPPAGGTAPKGGDAAPPSGGSPKGADTGKSATPESPAPKTP